MKKLILLGAGHSHLHFLKSLFAEKQAFDIQMISDSEISYYSGMLPGYITGNYSQNEIEINAKKLCQKLNINFCKGAVASINPKENELITTDGQNFKYDILSINTGSIYQKIPSTEDFANRLIYLKPWPHFIQTWNKIISTFNKTNEISLAVIGGGIASVEIALSLKAGLNQHKIKSSVFLLTDKEFTLQGSPPSLVRTIQKILTQNEIRTLCKSKVTSIKSGILVFNNKTFSDSSSLSGPFDAIFVSTQATPPAYTQNLNLQLDEHGFIKVNSYLQAQENIYVTGDSASFGSPSIPKSGVHAIRQGKILTHNLKSLLTGDGKLKCYKAPRRTLSILTTGIDTACLNWGNITLSGHLPWLLKKYIDQNYMNTFVGKTQKSS